MLATDMNRRGDIKVAACTMVRNEQAHILEWIVYHRLMGFDALIVVDNGSSDKTAEVVQSVVGRLPVRLIVAPSDRPDRQMRTYEAICRRYVEEFDWIAFLDGDEFLVPDHPMSVKTALRNRESAVAVGWSIYGSSGHVAAPPGLVIENYLRRSPLDFGPNQHVKSIVRPGKVIEAINPHVFAIHGQYTDADGVPVEWAMPGVSQQPLADRSWRVNHYLTRSADHWDRRLARRQPGNNARAHSEFTLYDRNEILDPIAAQYAPRVKECMQELSPAMTRL